MMQETLEKLGLTTNEIKVYLALLDIGNSMVSMIAKKTRLHRRPVYDSLNRLLEKGLVSYAIRAGKKYFQAANPAKLLEIAKEREKETQSILPDLISKFKLVKPLISSEIFEGKEGLKTIMADILKEGKDWLTIGSTGKAPKALPFYLEPFARRRVKLKINRKVLIADTPEGRSYAKNLQKQGIIRIKFLPREIQNPQTIWIYGNKVVIILASEEYPVMVSIENKNIANSYRDYFNWMWKIN